MPKPLDMESESRILRFILIFLIFGLIIFFGIYRYQLLQASWPWTFWSSNGFTDEDIETIAQIDGVTSVERRGPEDHEILVGIVNYRAREAIDAIEDKTGCVFDYGTGHGAPGGNDIPLHFLELKIISAAWALSVDIVASLCVGGLWLAYSNYVKETRARKS